jgi:hypothetical protein
MSYTTRLMPRTRDDAVGDLGEEIMGQRRPVAYEVGGLNRA